MAPTLGVPLDLGVLAPGKLLRSRLAGRLAAAGSPPPDAEALARVCAAVELVHTASLCHDDVMDGGLLRRGVPALWRKAGRSGAVLIGDLLLCEATELLLDTAGGRYVRDFVEKVAEVCAAEAEQEVALRGRALNAATCLRLARSKSGPLFAFAARVTGGADQVLSAALEEAGYRVGTAYQLADDLLDVLGQEEVSGKTLGTDDRRGKFTLACDPKEGHKVLTGEVQRLCSSAVECLKPWARAQQGLRRFLARDLRPVFARYGTALTAPVDGAL
jgi:geranylgeranyl pyrophosphate synthase